MCVAGVAGTFHHGNYCLKQRGGVRFVAARARSCVREGARVRPYVCVYLRVQGLRERVHRHASPAQVYVAARVVALRGTTRTISKITVDTRNYRLLSRYSFFMRAQA